MEKIHTDTDMEKITREGDSLTSRLRDELLDSTNLTKGSLFDNIIKINEKMTKQMGVRIDLRTPSAMAAEDAPQVFTNEADRQKAFEEKCEKCIEQFSSLNRQNELILDR